MRMHFHYGETITLLTEHRDEFGDVTLTEDRRIEGCAWSPSAQTMANTSETGGVSEQLVSGRTLVLPPHSGVLPTHRVRLADGTVWEVRGEVTPWRNPMTGWYPADEVELRKVRG